VEIAHFQTAEQAARAEAAAIFAESPKFNKGLGGPIASSATEPFEVAHPDCKRCAQVRQKTLARVKKAREKKASK